MKEKWVVSAKKADFNGIGAHFGIDPVIARLMRNRGMTDISEMELYLRGTEDDLHDPHLLKDADRAAQIISEKIRSGEKIRIIGDYDIDGIQATYILLKALHRLGADVDTVIPDRVLDGYGLNEHLVTRASEEGIDTILTCDNGISAIDQIHTAKVLGMTVIVTDHHEIPYEEADGQRREMLPEADAIVNPKQRDCAYPFSGLCGAAVAFKLVQILYEQAGISVSEADVFLENAGFATVGDVMDLQGENRILVKLGLDRLRKTQNKGMRALILQKNLDAAKLKAYHIGFVLGPCLNASGRLETARLSLSLLLCEDAARAAVMAQEIAELNESRKLMTAQAVRQAEQVIEERDYGKNSVIVVFLPDCHESLAGIVAGRIREMYYRPVFVITRGEKACKGSGRSIDGYSMYEEMCKCRELFLKFGGHPMAAGFSVEEKNIDLLRTALNERTSLSESDLIPKVTIDVPMPIDYLYEDLIRQLELLEPFGKGNEKPVFADRNLEIESLKVFGREGRVIRMKLKSGQGTRMDAVYFGDVDVLKETLEEKYGRMAAEDTVSGRCVHHVSLHFLYYPEIDTYYTHPRIQLKISGFCA
ncbi:MAG: single-stranded-DNA-specific exonuclease RecJ [Clostridiales bacterium]|nr:single-stranded-DNA-specific exonuclease RecJ [Clostridiales bacterium]